MKQKKRTETEQLHKVRISLFSISLLTLFMMVFISCNNEKKVDDEKKNNEKKEEIKVAALTNPTQWPVFRLDRATIQACNDLFQADHRSVILKHQLMGLENDGRVVMNLIGFASQNQGLHARGKNECFNTTPVSYTDIDGTVILGNNYLNWRVIGDAIFTNASHTTLKANFGYILLTPTTIYDAGQHPGRPMVVGHLWYKLTYYDTEGNLWDPQPAGGGGAGSSNPSPPADPTP